jgi:hypothetical protein
MATIGRKKPIFVFPQAKWYFLLFACSNHVDVLGISWQKNVGDFAIKKNLAALVRTNDEKDLKHFDSSQDAFIMSKLSE